MRNRIAIRYAVAGDIRFISHHDMLRVFERAIARAQIPVRFSEGFNPRPKMSLTLPKPVGVASLDELLVLELDGPMDVAEVAARLAHEMPAGVTVHSGDMIADGERRLPSQVEYGVEFPADIRDTIALRVETLMAEASHVVDRKGAEGSLRKRVDIRPYLLSIDLGADQLTWRQTVTQAGTARPEEVLEALSLPAADYLHRVRRIDVSYGT